MVFSGISMIGTAFALFPVYETSTQTLLPSLPETIGIRDDFSSACPREAHRHKAVRMPSIRHVLFLDTCVPPPGSDVLAQPARFERNHEACQGAEQRFLFGNNGFLSISIVNFVQIRDPRA